MQCYGAFVSCYWSRMNTTTTALGVRLPGQSVWSSRSCIPRWFAEFPRCWPPVRSRLGLAGLTDQTHYKDAALPSARSIPGLLSQHSMSVQHYLYITHITWVLLMTNTSCNTTLSRSFFHCLERTFFDVVSVGSLDRVPSDKVQTHRGSTARK